jgi:hypothetical protein
MVDFGSLELSGFGLVNALCGRQKSVSCITVGKSPCVKQRQGGQFGRSHSTVLFSHSQNGRLLAGWGGSLLFPKTERAISRLSSLACRATEGVDAARAESCRLGGSTKNAEGVCQYVCLLRVRYKAFRVTSCRLLVSTTCWKMREVSERTRAGFLLDTVEVWGSSPRGPIPIRAQRVARQSDSRVEFPENEISSSALQGRTGEGQRGHERFLFLSQLLSHFLSHDAQFLPIYAKQCHRKSLIVCEPDCRWRIMSPSPSHRAVSSSGAPGTWQRFLGLPI